MASLLLEGYIAVSCKHPSPTTHPAAEPANILTHATHAMASLLLEGFHV